MRDRHTDEPVEIECDTADLCALYGGCDKCPGFLARKGQTPVFCIHFCHRVDADS